LSYAVIYIVQDASSVYSLFVWCINSLDITDCTDFNAEHYRHIYVSTLRA